jgi:hypothetical protein
VCQKAEIPGIQVDLKAVESNIVFFSLRQDLRITPEELVERLEQEKGVHIGGKFPYRYFFLVWPAAHQNQW